MNLVKTNIRKDKTNLISFYLTFGTQFHAHLTKTSMNHTTIFVLVTLRNPKILASIYSSAFPKNTFSFSI